MLKNSDRIEDGTPDAFSLSISRDKLTSADYIDKRTRAAVTEVLAGITTERRSPLSDLQDILDGIRNEPPGAGRIAKMNAFVRTLGEPENLATFVDLLKDSLAASDADDAEISHRSRRGRMHCIYGWAGQTLLLASHPEPTGGTVEPADNLGEFLGYPPAEWDLSIHIWQPNPEARGFASTKQIEPRVIVEPPHSHPFDFVSFVVMGEMHQSIYSEGTHPSRSCDSQDAKKPQRYDGVILERVDGVWPPHREYQPTHIHALEERVKLQPSHSYYMPSHAIHDVEIDRATASQTPTITLFLCAEATVKPHAFMVPDMAEYHRQNPDIKDAAVSLSINQWENKLSAVADYLRGRAATLNLDEVVQCGSTYGFMHV